MVGALDLISVGSWEWIRNTINSEADGINSMYIGICNLMTKNEIYSGMVDNISDNIKSAVGGIALTLIALFLLLDFIKKSTDLKWVTWENVLMFFVKFIFAKVFVENAGWVMDCIYNGFSSLTTAVFDDPESLNLIGSGLNERLPYFLNSFDRSLVIQEPSIGILDFRPVGIWLIIIIQSFIMKGILVMTLIIVLARFIELTIYTIAAPLPFATLGSDGLQDIGKSYLKSYVACCLHAMVIILIFMSYKALNSIPTVSFDIFDSTGFFGLIKTFILGATVMKSEQWAKRICGAI